MKKTLSTLGIGAGLLVGLSSCQSSDFGDYPGGYEEAMPMSELNLSDGELPPWVLEGDDSEQIAAGDYTDDIYAVPGLEDIGEAPAEQASASPTSQNQPAVAATAAPTPQDDVVVDRGPEVAPDTFTPTAEHATIVRATAAVAEAAKTSPAPAAKPVAAAKKKTTKKPAAKTAKIDKKKIKKVDKPTMVTYKVQPGDNLSLIARRSNTTVEQIRKDSGIKGDTIYAGQIIKVRYLPKGYKPGDKVSAPSSHTVKRGESLSRIANQYGVTTEELMQANGLTKKTASRIYAGKKLTIPARVSKSGNASAKSSSYTVKRGESLSGIAAKHGVTTSALMKANGLNSKSAARIYAGQKLTIPGKASANSGSKAATATTHTVKSGETISSIAMKHGLTTGQLLKANKMSNADAARLQIGKTLTIPAKR